MKEQNNEIKEEKKSKSTAILIIFFILIFAFVMVLPNIENYLVEQKNKKAHEVLKKREEELEKQEQEKQKKLQEEIKNNDLESKNVITNCTFTKTLPDNTKNIEVVSIDSINNKIQSYSVSNDLEFILNSTNPIIATYKEVCNQAKVDGLNITCSSTPTTFKRVLSYNLKEYKLLTPLLFNLDSNLDTSIESLKSKGYVCK